MMRPKGEGYGGLRELAHIIFMVGRSFRKSSLAKLLCPLITSLDNYAIFASGYTTSETVATNVIDVYKL